MATNDKAWFNDLANIPRKEWCCRWMQEDIGLPNMEECFRIQYPGLPAWFGVNFCFKCGGQLKSEEEIPLPPDDRQCCFIVTDILGLEVVNGAATDEEGKVIAIDQLKVEHCPHCGRVLQGLQVYTEHWRDNPRTKSEISGDSNYRVQKINSCWNCLKAVWKNGEGKCHKFLRLNPLGLCDEHPNHKDEGCSGCGGCL